MDWLKHKPYILLNGILGGLILVVFATINRVVHGYPLGYDAYVFPFIFGFASWSIIGIFLFGWFDTRNELARVEALTILDPLTDAYNRRFFDENLKKLCEKSIRDNTPISLAMLDIDHFKTVNDTYGHQCGDYVLRRLAIILKQNNRACDFICRYDGEEFAILLPQTGLNKAVEFAERNRANCAKHKIEFVGRVPYDTSVTHAMVACKSISEFSNGKVSEAIKAIWHKVEKFLED